MLRFLVILSAIASFSFNIPLALAQQIGQAPLQYSVNPEVPGPNSLVLIQVQGVGNFLGEATITWKQDGKTVLSGVGERSYRFTTGVLGSKTTISVTINSPSQGTFSKSFTFNPSSVLFVWEADTSIPQWYKGKALYTAGSKLSITAFPQVVSGGKTLSSSALSFQWKRNDTPLPQSSGIGFSHISFNGNQLFPSETVSVTVLSGGTPVAQGSITVPAVKPEVNAYVRDPLRGVLFDSALGSTVSLEGSEFTVKAEPFYFDNSSLKSGSVPYAWTLNGEKITGPQSAQGILTLRQSGSGAGQAALAVSMQNTNSSQYVQSAKAAFKILFGGASDSAFNSFFGL
jgi:hypothetical protein